MEALLRLSLCWPADCSPYRRLNPLLKATGGPFVATTIQVVIAGALLLIVAAASGTVSAFRSLSAVPLARDWRLRGPRSTSRPPFCCSGPRRGVLSGSSSRARCSSRSASILSECWGCRASRLRRCDDHRHLAVLAGAAAIVFVRKAPDQLESRSSDGSCSRCSPARCCRSRRHQRPLAQRPRRALRGRHRQLRGGDAGNGRCAADHARADRRCEPAAYRPCEDEMVGMAGAFCGATYVTTVFTAIPVIGTAAAVGLTVAGQHIASLFVHRYGWFRLPRREISALRYQRRCAAAYRGRTHPDLLTGGIGKARRTTPW